MIFVFPFIRITRVQTSKYGLDSSIQMTVLPDHDFLKFHSTCKISVSLVLQFWASIALYSVDIFKQLESSVAECNKRHYPMDSLKLHE